MNDIESDTTISISSDETLTDDEIDENFYKKVFFIIFGLFLPTIFYTPILILSGWNNIGFILIIFTNIIWILEICTFYINHNV